LAIRRLLFGLFAIVGFSAGLKAQSCSTFDVASIKLNTSGAGGGYPELSPGGGRFTATNQLMLELIMYAYNVSPLQISGIPGAFVQERFDVDATCEQPMTKEQLPGILRALLADRFHLAVRRESREQPVYALVAGRGGARLRESPDPGGMPSLRQNGYSFTFTNAAISDLAGGLSQLTGRRVLDKTGLIGRYDFKLSYAPDHGVGREGSNAPPPADNVPDSVFSAVREQLGLNLEAQKSQIDFIVVDRLERLIPN
jgi:uncharacterized protein (TIGR03435 family)